ncbi:hypothetical protein, partial [Neobacillus drentensis]|uniref:hypothetical protein n=1 Tax=Neobacillus drentensis TaxID=220684 RepID=UPI0030015D4C
MKIVKKLFVVLIAFLMVFNTSELTFTYKAVSAAINTDTDPAKLQQSDNLFTAGSPLIFEEEKSYAIKNQSSHSVNLEFEPTSPMNYDFVKYSSDEKIIQFEKDASGNIGLGDGESIRITPKNNLKGSIPNSTENEVFVSESEPALYRFTLEKDKHYEIKNTSNSSILMRNLSAWDKKAEMVVYDSDGKVRNIDQGWWGDLWLNAGEKVRLSVNPEQTQEAYIPYDQK